MVCVYCKAPTQVTNSRHQKKLNQVWRRRRCTACGAVFTSSERPDYTRSLSLKAIDGGITPFKREKLFLSILKSCEHRTSALDDAIGLTETVMGKIMQSLSDGTVASSAVAKLVHSTLRHFDHASAVQYAAYHAEYTLDT